MSDWRTDDVTEVRRDALSVLQDVLNWHLSSARWDGIADSIEALTASLGLGDIAAVQETVIQLELAGPVRITRIGAVPTEPAPRHIRERVNYLVHQLAHEQSLAALAEPADGTEGAEQPGGAS